MRLSGIWVGIRDFFRALGQPHPIGRQSITKGQEMTTQHEAHGPNPASKFHAKGEEELKNMDGRLVMVYWPGVFAVEDHTADARVPETWVWSLGGKCICLAHAYEEVKAFCQKGR
jgi:hypothetical protein